MLPIMCLLGELCIRGTIQMPKYSLQEKLEGSGSEVLTVESSTLWDKLGSIMRYFSRAPEQSSPQHSHDEGKQIVLEETKPPWFVREITYPVMFYTPDGPYRVQGVGRMVLNPERVKLEEELKRKNESPQSEPWFILEGTNQAGFTPGGDVMYRGWSMVPNLKRWYQNTIKI